MANQQKFFRLFKISDFRISLKELKRRYKILLFKAHPDHGGTSAKFRLVQEAYIYLKDKVEKRVKEDNEKIFNDKDHLYYGDGSVYSIKDKRWKVFKGRKVDIKV